MDNIITFVILNVIIYLNVMLKFLAVKHSKLHNLPHTVGQRKKKKKHRYLFQYKLSYRNKTGTNLHGLLSTLI